MKQNKKILIKTDKYKMILENKIMVHQNNHKFKKQLKKQMNLRIK